MHKIICFIIFCITTHSNDNFQWQDDSKKSSLKLKKNNNLLPSIKKTLLKAPSRVPFSNSLADDTFFSEVNNMQDLHQKVRSMQSEMFNHMQQLMGSKGKSKFLSSPNLHQHTNVKFIDKTDYLIVQIPVQSNNIQDFTLSLQKNRLQVKQTSRQTTSKKVGNSTSSSTSYSSSIQSIGLPIIPKAISNQMIAQDKLIVTLKK